jgi:hypothetical protein
MKYHYQMAGGGADNQTWLARGTVETTNAGDFHLVSDMALEDAFMQLTEGKAVYGKPGKGCHGPYVIYRMVVRLDGAPVDLPGEFPWQK